MRLEAILILPGSAIASTVTESGRQTIPTRVATGSDQFAAELQTHTSARVRVEEGSTVPPPVEGTMFLCAPDVLAPSLARRGDRLHTLASRIVVFDLVRTYALEWAEKYSLAAVIETRHYLNWQKKENPDPASLYGLKAAAGRFGAVWPPGPPFEGQHYALLSHPALRELPALLAGYLEAYAPLLPE